MELKAREGDLLETYEGLIFDVKGLVHPSEKIIAYLRYYPDPKGKRIREGRRYDKVYSLDKRYEFLEQKYPQYLFYDKVSGETLQGVPKENIRKLYRPAEFVKELLRKSEEKRVEGTSPLLRKTFEMLNLIHTQSRVDFSKIGITGSCLVNLETEQSDIDLIIYGSYNAYFVRDTLTALQKNYPEIIQPYSRENILKLYEFRGKDSNLKFDEFVKIEKRKKLQGIFKETDYFIRCIKDWDEVPYRKVQYKSLGTSTVKATVIDDNEAILTPCKYIIENAKIINGADFSEPIREVVSFRGRFCEQARKGEEIEARGKVERVTLKEKTYLRLLLGTYKEDYFRVLNL